MPKSLYTPLLFCTVIFVMVISWYPHQDRAPTPGERLAAYIPHDTVFMLGTLRGIPAGTGVAAWLETFGRLVPGQGREGPGAGSGERGALGVLTAIVGQLAQAARQDRAWPLGRLGFPRGGVIAAYTVAGVPVLRWQLADPGALDATLRAAERRAGADTQVRSRDGLQLRRYRFAGRAEDVALVIASGDGFALATLDSRTFDSRNRAAVLGITRPEAPFNARQLETLAAANGLIPGSVGVVDNGRLLAALSGTGETGRLIDALFDPGEGGAQAFPALRGAACHEEAAILFDFWPRTVLGLTPAVEDGGATGLRLVAEITKKEVLAGLDRLQGRVPDSVWSPQAVFAIGLGIDLGALPRLTTGVQRRVSDYPVACPAFASVHRRVVEGFARATEALAAVSDQEEAAGAIEGLGAALFPSRAFTGAARGRPAAGMLALATDEPDLLWQRIRPLLEGRSGLMSTAGSRSEGRSGIPLAGSKLRMLQRRDELALLTGDAQPDRDVLSAVPAAEAGSPPLFVLSARGEGISRPLEYLMRSMQAPGRAAQPDAFAATAQRLRLSGVGLELSAGVIKTGIDLEVTAHAPGRSE